MSLQCLALLGNTNAPIYMCASNQQSTNATTSITTTTTPPPREDLFGFFEDDDDCISECNDETKQCTTHRRVQVSLRHEMMFHAALDRLEEILGSNRKTVWKRFQRASNWIGQICSMEEYEIYGYVTSSDIKILALIDRDELIPLKKRTEVDIKILLTAVHDCYVKHTLNPFSKIKGQITPPCATFETNIQAAIDQYNATVQED